MHSTMSEIEVVGTQTHMTDAGARETVLVRVPLTAVGRANNYPPPNPYDDALDTEMRRGYFHRGEDVIAQLPRRADDYQSVERRANLEAICSDEGGLTAYYLSDQRDGLQVNWAFDDDAWTIEETRFETEFLTAIQHAHADVVWQNHRDI